MGRYDPVPRAGIGSAVMKETPMRTRPRRPFVLAASLGLLGALALGGVAIAAETTLTAELAGVTEGANPGNPDGSGTASVTLDPETGEACWNLTAEGIGPV